MKTLEQAYRDTHYWLLLEDPVCLRIGQSCPVLVDWQGQKGVECSTIITAHNPESQRLADADNDRRQQAMESELAQAGWTWVRTEARDPDEHWPIESGILVWGMDGQAATPWAQRYGQYAVVLIDRQGIPQLQWFT